MQHPQPASARGVPGTWGVTGTGSQDHLLQAVARLAIPHLTLLPRGELCALQLLNTTHPLPPDRDHLVAAVGVGRAPATTTAAPAPEAKQQAAQPPPPPAPPLLMLLPLLLEGLDGGGHGGRRGRGAGGKQGGPVSPRDTSAPTSPWRLNIRAPQVQGTWGGCMGGLGLQVGAVGVGVGVGVLKGWLGGQWQLARFGWGRGWW